MQTRTFTIGEERFEVRPLNTQALIQHERSLAKHGIEKGSNEAGVELARVLLRAWVRDGKDLVTLLSPEKLRDELAEHDPLMVRLVKEAKALAVEISQRYEEDSKN